ncbi:hypothetical protein BFW01_g10174 [Lasiodiplodia theobromae]|uniref:Altered inheritance of mitochondria protein 6 n=1 Tax=Lasiodiplodia theobromae TaxID=45133 RepID=A0A5N5D794_9PEZI|nr:Altered inheritance of mitochondria protein 6-like protein [Lasiodiplodia theobromae]KAF9628971.1 hypothetical protein BFW01_g10174 [Lasiodiplodia theobromae]
MTRIWLSFAFLKVKSLLHPYPHSSAYSKIASLWKQPLDAVPLITYSSYSESNNDIAPLPCHSHNDYWRKVPLFEALSYGCASVEADIYLSDEPIHDGIKNIDLYVGHERSALDPDRTLTSLYLAPLFRILYEQTSPVNDAPQGVFQSSPSTPLVLLVDFKPSENSSAVWHALDLHMTTFRGLGWLTRWDREKNKRVPGLLTIVATGDAPFEEIAAAPDGDVFYDAPLEKLATDDRYNASNSYYASASLSTLVGKIGLGHSLSDAQMEELKSAVGFAKEKDLMVRAWDIPKWPVATRNKIWEQLLEAGVDVLNLDDFGTATSKDWRLCKIGGIELCT